MNALGRHFLIELWDPQNLDRPDIGEEALVECVRATGGTLLDTRFIPFPNGGYSGVCIIAESHVTIHTWPENNYAAVDMFTCGPTMDFDAGIDVLKKYFSPGQIQIVEVKRGLIA
ncbi:MAG TPA: adenosylmethionine decarboxylase [Actinomycetota bacterium]|jgi:S-adenosylmethionine decarboxylase